MPENPNDPTRPDFAEDDVIRSFVNDLARSAPKPPTFAEIIQRSAASGTAGSDPTSAERPHTDTTVVALGVRPSDEVDYVEPASSNGRVRPFRYLAAMVGFVVIAAGGVFAYGSVTSDDGASTPEAAVESFVDSLVSADVAGVLESLPPDERVVLRESIEGLKAQTDRLGLTDNLDLSKIDGIQIGLSGDGQGAGTSTVSSLKLNTESLGQSVAAVTVDGALRTNANGKELPLGPVARKLLAGVLPDGSYQGLADNVDRLVNNNPVRLVTVKDGGGWHVSVWYTIAEYIRRNTNQDHGGIPVPNFGGDAIKPVGAESPEAVVKALIEAGARHDYKGEIALTTPDESRVLYDYGPPLLASFDPAFGGYGPTAVNAKLTTGIEGEGDVRTVLVTGWDISSSYQFPNDGTFDGSDSAKTVNVESHNTFDGQCSTTTSTYDPQPAVDGQIPDAPDQACRKDLGSAAVQRVWDLRSTVRIVVERVGDRWFVSPVRTLAGQTTYRLSQVSDAAELQQVLNADEGSFVFLVDPIGLIFGGLPGPYTLDQKFYNDRYPENVSDPTITGPQATVPTPVPATPTTRPGG